MTNSYNCFSAWQKNVKLVKHLMYFIIIKVCDFKEFSELPRMLGVNVVLYVSFCTCVSVRMFLYVCFCTCVSVRMFLYACFCTCVSVRMFLYVCFCTCVSVRMFHY
jgi:hypothetical protein